MATGHDTGRLIKKYGLSRNGHAHFSPSGSAGWIGCDGYVLANAGLPDVSTVYAARGTVAHGVAATWLNAIHAEGRAKAEHVPKRFLNFKAVQEGHEIVVDEQMLFQLRRYIDYCAEVEALGWTQVEQRVSYSKFMPIPKQGGTADHIVMLTGLLIITDLKMGEGVRVFAEENTQALCYALGVFLKWDWLFHFETIRIRIAQPHLDYFGEWETTREYLSDFAALIQGRAIAGWREDAPRTPGTKQCQWCSDKLCAAKDAWLSDMVGGAFDDVEVSYDADEMKKHVATLPGKSLEIQNPARMSTAALAWRKRHRPMIEKHFREIDEILLKRELAGEKIPGFKVVPGRRSFSWKDEKKAVAWLLRKGLTAAEITSLEIISTAEAKKILKARGLSGAEIERIWEKGQGGLIDIVPGKPVLAPDTDDRIDYGDNVGAAFDDDAL